MMQIQFLQVRNSRVHSALCFAIVFFSAIGSIPSAGVSAGSSQWVSVEHSKVRLIPGSDETGDKTSAYLAGVHLTLDRGWKTYWRVPGEAGVPPVFNWSGSGNVKDVKVFYPAPKRLVDPYGTSIGYEDEVVFPVRVLPHDPGKSVDLNLELAFAVCKDICIPAEAKVTLNLARGSDRKSAEADLVSDFLERVPKENGPLSQGNPKIQSVNFYLDGDKPHVLIDAEFPKGAHNRDLFVEASDDFYLPLAKLVEGGSQSKVQYKIDLSGGDDPKQLAGRHLILTLVSDAGQSETRWDVNQALLR